MKLASIAVNPPNEDKAENLHAFPDDRAITEVDRIRTRDLRILRQLWGDRL